MAGQLDIGRLSQWPMEGRRGDPGLTAAWQDSLQGAVMHWVTSVGLHPLVETVTLDRGQSFHRGAGCVVMMGCDGEGVMEWIFVVLCGHDGVRWRRGHGMDLRGIVWS